MRYMKHMSGNDQHNIDYIKYVRNTYVDKRYGSILYQSYSKHLTNNISESINS